MMDQPSTLIRNTAHPPALAARQRSLILRIVTGVGAGVVVFSMDFLPGVHVAPIWHGFPWALFVGIVSTIAVSEFYSAVRRQGAEPSEPLGIITCVLFQIVAWHGEGNTIGPYLSAFLTMLVLAIMLVELVKPKQKPILNIGSTLLGGIYCGWLFSYLVLLHEVKLPLALPIPGTSAGDWLVLYVIAITSANDIGGLIVGSALGRHKLAPNISPAKTWEGALGGVALAALAGGGIGAWLKMPVLGATEIGVALAVVGLIGDLCESAMKRELGVKDFGVLLPGHGGILDRVDSILFAGPVGYYLIGLLLRH